MIRISVFNGPNLGLLGRREPEIYGRDTLASIQAATDARAAELGDVELTWFQSDSEGELVSAIGRTMGRQDGIVINPAAYTHTSVAIRDAIAAVGLPCVELHLSNVHKREEFRHHSFVSPVSLGVICGFGAFGYILALEALVHHIRGQRGGDGR